MKKPFGKYIKILGISFLILVIFILALNLKDESLNPEITELLNKTKTPTSDQEAKSCAMALALTVDAETPFEEEGLKIYRKLEKIDDIKNLMDIQTKNKNSSLSTVKQVQLLEKCEKDCKLSPKEITRLDDELLTQKVFIDRLEKIISAGPISCKAPAIFYKIQTLIFYTTFNNLLLNYKLKSIKDKSFNLISKLVTLDTFLVNSLHTTSYSLMSGLIYASSINRTRDMIKSNIGETKLLRPLDKINYELITKQIIDGEFKAAYYLLNQPMGVDFLFYAEMFNVGDMNSELITKSLYPNVISPAINYFYLKNATINEELVQLRKSPWQPCIGQKDIACDVEGKPSIMWMRNPVGKSVLYAVSSNLSEHFKKLKKKVDSINNIKI